MKRRGLSDLSDRLQHADWRSIMTNFSHSEADRQSGDEVVAALLAALQLGDMSAAEHWVRAAFRAKLERQVLLAFILASVENTLGLAEAIGGNHQKALRRFNHAKCQIHRLSIEQGFDSLSWPHASYQLRQKGYLVQSRQFITAARHVAPSSKIRMVHHFACTGGTMICKCIASMKNTAVVSEIHPNPFGGVHFNPVDPLQVLLASGQVSLSREDRGLLFRERLEGAVDACQQNGKVCVLRDHTHSDYCLGGREQITHRAVRSALSAPSQVQSLVTVRHPLDSYASMYQYGWHRGVGSFDEYCYRYLLFLGDYREAPIIKYERFCEAPDAVMREICKILEIAYNPDFLDSFAAVKLTGDSGRGRAMATIEPLPEKRHPEWLLQEAEDSDNYRRLQAVLNY